MQLDSVRELKAHALSEIVTPLAAAVEARITRSAISRTTERAAAASMSPATLDFVIAIAAQPMAAASHQQRSIALGIALAGRIKGKPQYRLAIRVQRQSLLSSRALEKLVKYARNEADVRFIGRIKKRGPAVPQPWHRSRRRPLEIGCSVSHHLVTAGTLGCFVTTRRSKKTYLLSNNHVLANENAASVGDAIVQPGSYDGGHKVKDRVAVLDQFVKLKMRSPNLVDCAMAELADHTEPDRSTLRIEVDGKRGSLAGVSPPDALDEGITVHKIGRTTGATTGVVTAFEMDHVIVGYDSGNLRFDGQIEIESATTVPFSDGGDSGSLILDSDFRALGLLFAGGDTGGRNGLGLTYANPADRVLNALRVDLAI